ncbi:MAG: hypothetical protein A3E01_03015 [Gammaproteobacteria bacterium RIFCSPHIGHO2_12_FULL_63_22]|nr:MAG: hypothetical protein A3E01_03015 [Gammaproteobacteria bacterium RIFCSPHIGHO2_12_FULL_63_22]
MKFFTTTRRENDLLEFIRARIATDGIAPSFIEMRQHLGLSSSGGVHRLLGGLEERGRIRRKKFRARCIEITEERCPNCGHDLHEARA